MLYVSHYENPARDLLSAGKFQFWNYKCNNNWFHDDDRNARSEQISDYYAVIK